MVTSKKPSSKTKATAESSPSKKNSRKAKPYSPETIVAALKQAQLALVESPQLGVVPALRKVGICSPIVLAGNQAVRAKRIVNWVKEQFFANNSSSTSSYFGLELSSQSSITHILSSLGTRSLFSRDSLLVIYESEKVKSALAEILAERISSDQDSTLVIILTDSLDKAGSLASRLSDVGSVVELKELDHNSLRRWLDKEARRCGCSGIDSPAAEALIKNYGADTSSLAQELEKLSLLTEPGKNISKELVIQLSNRSPEVTSFQLISLLANRNAAGGVALSKDLVDQGMHPIQICHFLSRCFRMLLANKDPSPELNSELSNNWFLNQIRGSLKAFSEKELRATIEVIKKLDFQLKDSALPDTLALGLAVQKIALRQFARG